LDRRRMLFGETARRRAPLRLVCARAQAVALLILVTGSGRAAESRAQAARLAYDSAAAAYDSGDFNAAAEQFARADELAPNPTTLKLALAAALRAEMPVLAVNLTLRVERRPTVDEDTLRLSRAARDRFQSRVGLLTVHCANKHMCRVKIDEQQVEPEQPIALNPGQIELSFSEGQTSVTRRVEVLAGRTLSVTEPPLIERAPAPPLAPPPAVPAVPAVPDVAPPVLRPEASGLPPAVFWCGVALTGALTAASIASGVDAAHAHDAFLAQRSDDTRQQGQAAVERTNVLVAGAVGTALISATVGLFFTKWHAPLRASAHAPSFRLSS
jgi:hypothetical protein